MTCSVNNNQHLLCTLLCLRCPLNVLQAPHSSLQASVVVMLHFAERANRVLSERLTTMLDESGLPKAFWGEALGALVHVWNRCPTDAVKNATPYQLWTGTKPDVSHLRVWGCTAYVHIQKDKRDGLGSHMEKCAFIGYPQGYKGWKFYNPTTKKVVISERADFDERYFPMSKRPTSASFPAPSAEVESTPSTTPAPVPRTSPAVPKPDSNSYYFPPDCDNSDCDSDDESSSDESLDHGGDMGTLWMADCKPISTPMQPNTRLTRSQSPQTPEEVQYMKSVPYLAASWQDEGTGS